VLQTGFYDQPWKDRRTIDTSPLDFFGGNESILTVQGEDGEDLGALRTQEGREVTHSILSGMKRLVSFPPILQIPIHESGNHRQENRRMTPHPVNLLQMDHRSVHHRRKTAEPRQELLGERLHVTARDGIGEQELDDLVIVKPVESALLKTLTQALAMAVVHG
jgi:hypothetical protein